MIEQIHKCVIVSITDIERDAVSHWLRKQVALRPFRPFQIETSGGTPIRVSRPEWIYFPPETGHFVVFEGAVGSYISFHDVRSVLVEQPPVPVNGQPEDQ